MLPSTVSEMCFSEFWLPLLSNVSLTFLVLQQTHSSPPQVSRGLPHRLCATLCVTIASICTQITYISLNIFCLLESLVLTVNFWVQSSSLKSFNIVVCNLNVRTHMRSLSATALRATSIEGTTQNISSTTDMPQRCIWFLRLRCQ